MKNEEYRRLRRAIDTEFIAGKLTWAEYQEGLRRLRKDNMGMYDTCEVPECVCPHCDASIEKFSAQTKNLDNNLVYYKTGDKIPTNFTTGEFELHGVCPFCKQYFIMTGLIVGGKYVGIKGGSETVPDWAFYSGKENAKYFAEHRKELAEKYHGNRVVIYKGRCVCYGNDVSRLQKYLLSMYPEAEKEGYLLESV